MTHADAPVLVAMDPVVERFRPTQATSPGPRTRESARGPARFASIGSRAAARTARAFAAARVRAARVRAASGSGATLPNTPAARRSPSR